MKESKKKYLFDEVHEVGGFLLNWWENLKENRGDRAEIKRCKSLKQVQLTSAFQRCYWQLINLFDSKPTREQTAIIIGLGAHVYENEATRIKNRNTEKNYFAFQIAKAREGADSPRLSELRFRRLLNIKNNDRDKLYRYLMQIIKLLDRKVNLLDLLSIAFYWGENSKRNLAYKYYEIAQI